MVQAGATIETFRLFIPEYTQAGGMITGIEAGEGINGTTSEYLTSGFSETGRAGKMTGIGRRKKPGVSGVWNPGRRVNHIVQSSSRESITEEIRKNRDLYPGNEVLYGSQTIFRVFRGLILKIDLPGSAPAGRRKAAGPRFIQLIENSMTDQMTDQIQYGSFSPHPDKHTDV